MLKPGDTAYFVFKGDFSTGRYKNFYCKPYELKYFPFYPVLITTIGYTSYQGFTTSNIQIGSFSRWIMPTELLEEEFSLTKFLVAIVNWDGAMTKANYTMLANAVRGE